MTEEEWKAREAALVRERDEARCGERSSIVLKEWAASHRLSAIREMAAELLACRTERDAALAQVAALREALDDAADVLGIFRLFQSVTKGMKAHWPVVQYGNQSLTKATFDDALETHDSCQRVLADTAAAAQERDERIRSEEREACNLIAMSGWAAQVDAVCAAVRDLPPEMRP